MACDTSPGVRAWMSGMPFGTWRLDESGQFGLDAGLIVTSALMIWKTLILVTGSESPVRAASVSVHITVLLL